MLKVDFSTNPNGKLFTDTFGTVRMPDGDKYYTANQLEVTLKGAKLGIVKVVAVRPFQYNQIRDVLSYLEIGKPAHYLAEITRRYYNPEGILTPDTMLYHVVLQYVQRDIENQRLLLQEWWQLKIEDLNNLNYDGHQRKPVAPKLCFSQPL